MAATLLIVHHTSSPSMQAMLEAVRNGAGADGLEDVEVRQRPALSTTASDVLEASGVIVGTSANIGYLAGAVKHFFDQIYYPCLEAKVGAPYGLYVHGNSDTSGAVRAAASITKALGWKQVHEPVVVIGGPQKADLDACWDLGATVAATLLG